jgi:hypothetical protein
MALLTFIPNATSKTTAITLGLDDVPEDVRKDGEDVYEALKTHAGSFHAKFDTVQELNLYIAQLKAYCENRPNGAIRFRKSPAKGLPANEMKFRITDVETASERQTREIREAAEAAQANAGKPAK